MREELVFKVKDRAAVEAEAFLKSLCKGGERTLIIKQDDVISKVREVELMSKTKDRVVEAEAFLKSLCEGGERILIVKQDGVISEIRGKVECSCTAEWITLKMPGCRCHVHVARAELAKAAFVVRAKAEGQMSYSVEIKSQAGALLLKIYFPAASDEPAVAQYERLRALYGEEVVFSGGPDGS